MRLRFAILAAAFVGLPLTAARSEPSRVPEPPAPSEPLSKLTDDLQRLQMRMADGDVAAYPETVALLKTAAAAIAAAPPDTWKDKRQSDALAIYILSGGPLAEVIPIMRGETIPAAERPLAQGALAYMSGHDPDALERLRTVDVETLDSRLAGEVAFARAALEARRDPKEAVSLLDWARLVAPGTLVEEVALRREAALLAETHDPARMALMMREYINRFPRSVYASEFFRGFGRTLADAGLSGDPVEYRRLSQAAAALPPDTRRDFLLGLAKAATIGGQFDAAATAATDALEGMAPDSPQGERARLYLAAGQIFTADPETARAALHALSPGRLDRDDAALLAAARSVAAQVRLMPAPGAIDAQADAMSKDATGAGATIASAEGALRQTANLVDGASP